VNLSLEELQREYTSALRQHLVLSDEVTLQAAYEIGRRALVEGMGVLDMAAIFHRAMVAVSTPAGAPREAACRFEALESFLLESLSPFEMAHRGAREANTALHRQNEVLEEQFKRIAHEVHDVAGQLLASAHLSLAQMQKTAPQLRTGIVEVRRHLDRIEEQMRRLSHELRPTVLDDLGLLPAIRFLSEGVSTRSGLQVQIESPTVGRLRPPLEIALYRIVQEALANVVKHARASQVRVGFEVQDGWIHCRVGDDGVGLDRSPASAEAPATGLGLIGIRDRVASLGGTLKIESSQDHGTELCIALPLESAHEPSRRAG
jgi:signal transduction histidine kinase